MPLFNGPRCHFVISKLVKESFGTKKGYLAIVPLVRDKRFVTECALVLRLDYTLCDLVEEEIDLANKFSCIGSAGGMATRNLDPSVHCSCICLFRKNTGRSNHISH